MTFVKRIEGTMSSQKMITTLLLLLASLCVSAPAKAESADQRQVYACGRIHNQQSTNIKEDTQYCAEYLEPRLHRGCYFANPSACPSLYKAVNVKGTTGNANKDRYQMGCVLAKSLETCMAIAREKAGKMTSGGPSALQENNELANQAIWHIISNYPHMKQDKELRALGKKAKAPDHYFN
jgi:hypothetical protein